MNWGGAIGNNSGMTEPQRYHRNISCSKKYHRETISRKNYPNPTMALHRPSRPRQPVNPWGIWWCALPIWWLMESNEVCPNLVIRSSKGPSHVQNISPNSLKIWAWKPSWTRIALGTRPSRDVACISFTLSISRWGMACARWREVSFPVPWGVISGKEWGPSDGKPFLGLHGFLDNANTFDKLVPLLPQDIRFVAIDFPGHGQSSHRPLGTNYDDLERVADVRRVVDQLQWKEFSIVGHSMGGGVGALYAGSFPTELRHLVLIETAMPPGEEFHPADYLARYVKWSTSEKDIKAAAYPNHEAMAEKLMNTSPYHLTKEAARSLVQRGSVPSNDNSAVHFSHDKRIRDRSAHLLSVEVAGAILGRITCKVLYVKGERQEYGDKLTRRVQKRLQFVRNAERFAVRRVSGDHFVHMHNPELVAKEIVDFLRPCNNSSSIRCVSKL